MKKILDYLKNHVKEDFNPWVYGLAMVFLSASIYYNYTVDFEDSFLDRQVGVQKVLYFFIFYSLPFYSTLFLYGVVHRDFSFFQSGKLWIISTMGFLLLSFDSSALFLSEVTRFLFPGKPFFWGFKVANNLMSILTIILPLLIISILLGRNNTHLYGLNTRKFAPKPYLLLLLFMLPLILLATQLPSFLKQYPMYNNGGAMQNYPTPEYLYAGIYEIAYGLNFISVELFFRGFLVVGLMSRIGRKAVLAMAATYCFLHFGKPAGEAISSIFGGYILGVIAYETKTIWGGVMIHVGIAWSMEVAAILMHSIK